MGNPHYEDSMPDFMTNSELVAAGFNIELSSEPYINLNKLDAIRTQGIEKKKYEAYYERSFSVINHVLSKTTGTYTVSKMSFICML